MSDSREQKINRILLLERALYQAGHLSPEVYALRKEITAWWEQQPSEMLYGSSPWSEELARLEAEVGPFQRTQPIIAGYDANDPSMHHPTRRNPGA